MMTRMGILSRAPSQSTVSKDITKRKMAEVALPREELFHETLIVSSPGATVILDD